MTSTESCSTVERIETLVVDPEAVIEAFERNRDADDDGRHVIRVSAPFETEATAARFASGGESNRADAPAVDLGPEAFVNVRGEYDPERTRIPAPSRAESRSIARSDRGADVDEATVAEYHETALEAWRECVRTSLVEAVPLVDPETGDETRVDVRYAEID